MTTAIYEKRNTVLLIVDPYNDFMSEGGKLYAATKPTADLSASTRTCESLFPRFALPGFECSSCLITVPGRMISITG